MGGARTWLARLLAPLALYPLLLGVLFPVGFAVAAHAESRKPKPVYRAAPRRVESLRRPSRNAFPNTARNQKAGTAYPNAQVRQGQVLVKPLTPREARELHKAEKRKRVRARLRSARKAQARVKRSRLGRKHVAPTRSKRPAAARTRRAAPVARGYSTAGHRRVNKRFK